MATQSEVIAFIKKLGTLAVNESNRRLANGEGFVLPSICIAQSAIETGYGTSGLMTRANAYFGIKAGGSWTGKVYTAGTWEVKDGSAYNTTANFRAYDSLEESVRDYYDLILNSSRYSKAISYGADRSQWLSPKATITAIWQGGYATDTLYVEKVVNIVNSRKLSEWDMKVDGINDVKYFKPLSFDISQFANGMLEIQDSGRSLGIASNVPDYITLKDYFTVEFDGMYKFTISGIDNPSLKMVYGGVVNDVATIDGVNGITFYNNEIELPLMTGVQYKLSLWLLNSDMTVDSDFIKNAVINLTYGEIELPESLESYSTPLAYFKKI